MGILTPDAKYFEQPIRATAAKEAGQEMPIEETAVRPNQIEGETG